MLCLLVQTPVAPPQPKSIIHFAFTGPTWLKSIFLWWGRVKESALSLWEPLHSSFCLMENLMPQRIHVSQTAAWASCSALASTWVWLASPRICFDCCYITWHLVLCVPTPACFQPPFTFPSESTLLYSSLPLSTVLWTSSTCLSPSVSALDVMSCRVIFDPSFCFCTSDCWVSQWFHTRVFDSSAWIWHIDNDLKNNHVKFGPVEKSQTKIKTKQALKMSSMSCCFLVFKLKCECDYFLKLSHYSFCIVLLWSSHTLSF